MTVDPRDDHSEAERMRLAVQSLILDSMEEIIEDNERMVESVDKQTLNKTTNGYQALKELLAQVKDLPISGAFQRLDP